MTAIVMERPATSTAQNLAKLADLRQKSGKLVHERVKLAVAVYMDRQWIADSFAGDPNAAAEHLEAEFLGDICGAMSFLELTRIYQAIPDYQDWEQHKFNLKRLQAEMRSRQSKEEKHSDPRRSATVKELEEAQERRREAEYTVKLSREEAEQLRARVSELERENSKLLGRIEELERQLSKRN